MTQSNLAEGPSPTQQRPDVLATQGVSMAFRGLKALQDVTIALPEGTVTGLIGPNGAGKTTLVNVLSGLAAPTEGEVFFEGERVRRWTLGSAARAGVAKTFQQSRVFGEFTVLENVELGALNSRHDVDAFHVLEMLDLAPRWNLLAGELSFGELRRLGVAIALATRPKVLLMDEPGAGLTGVDLDQLSVAIGRIRDEGTTILVIDHNMRFLMNSVERVIVLEGGMVISQGTPAHVQTDERVIAAYLGGSHVAD
ncbi:ABC transporter ATP-binding protein [Nocardioides sp. AE5]|uniref:ABC transporter ATP-binding protein n=1 Tax=Nocardioides sp. AE5 TaxID=2962573 RepID=UPI002880D474|nr:ABC transporter ATP-binding protein [Nocardioides sp. AE5]MDT0202721.1 ABC transporter ATP-binding protein [Nocardioides sp. AE5]